MEFYFPSGNLQEKRRFQAVALVGELEYFLLLLLHKRAAGAAAPGQVVTGGMLGRRQQSPSREGGLGAPLSRDAPRAGPGWAFPQRECGRVAWIN